MATFFELLREALAPEFLLERELGSGGMGTVFLAREVALDRLVAIKTMRPEEASAPAVERFQSEAQTLARLRHAHIVPVHSTGVVRGLGTPFYVMDYLDGETLEQRLEHGPLSEADATRLCRQLLDALTVAHRHGIVHRDVKPSNVFLEAGEVVLTDFGIAKRLNPSEGALTAPGQAVGTPLYMPPEQSAGREVTPRTDLYATGAVVYEALTGRQWLLEHPDAIRWDGVSRRLQLVLSRALAEVPAQRWPDAGTFREALAGATTRSAAVRWAVRLGVLAAIAGAAVVAWRMPRGPVATLRIESLRVDHAGPWAFLGDSLATLVARRLKGFPDLTVLGPGERGRAHGVVTGVTDLAGSTLRVTMMLGERPFGIAASPQDWQAAGDELADSLLMRVFSGTALDSQLPVRVLPRSPDGLRAFLTAEKLFASAHWQEANAAYDRATKVDSTCWLCWWRRGETRRWLGLDADTAAIRRTLDHIALFPAQYQSLIRVDTLLLLARFDTLHQLRSRFPTFLFGLFRYGDELMHRGALIGRDPGEAARYFQDALNVRSDFAPAVEHMLWLALLVDDSARAASALAAVTRTAAQQQLTSGIPQLLQVAYAWRFLPGSQAEAGTLQAIAGAKQLGIGNLDVGARYMNGFSLPRGEVWIGKALEDDPRYRRSALIAGVFGEFARGRPDSARVALGRLQEAFPDPGNTLLGLELDALRLLLVGDPEATTLESGALAMALDHMVEQNIPEGLKRRSAWLSQMLHCRFRTPQTPGHRVVPVFPVMLEGMIQACGAAQAGRLADALAATERFTELSAPLTWEYPAYRAAVHALRSRWSHQLGRDDAAARELVWVENFDEATLPTGDPQPMEIDWALRPLARWQRVLLVAPNSRREEQCRLYRSVDRYWRDGEAAFAARADSAVRQASDIHCPASAP